MRFAHNCYDSYLACGFVGSISESCAGPEQKGSTHTRCSSNWSRFQRGQQSLFILVRYGTDNVHQARYAAVIKLFAPFIPNFVQRHRLARFMRLDQIGGDCRRDSDQLFCLRRCGRGIDRSRHEPVEVKGWSKCLTNSRVDSGV